MKLLVVVPLVLYLTVCVLAWWLQARLMFLPMGTPGAPPQVVPGSPVPAEDVTLKTSDGLSLHAWWLQSGKARGTVLFCHGNAGNLSHRLDAARPFLTAGCDVLLFDYRGYGKSEGAVSEVGLERDADAAYQWLMERGVPPDRVVVYGESLGGAVAVGLAARRPVAGLIAESTFTSMPDVAARLYWWLPARALCRFQFASDELIGQVDAPVLIIHSPDDEIVSDAFGRELFERASHPKTFLETWGGHNDGGYRTDAKTERAVRTWLHEALPSH